VSESLVCIVPPAAEPVSLDDFRSFLEIPADDTSHDAKLSSLLVAAREDCERYTRTKLVTQTWLLRTDSFPSISVVYDRNGYPKLQLPFPPFQSIDFFKYVDTAGAVQTIQRDTTYGNNPAAPFYGYQLEPGGGLIPARLLPNWARPWAPQRLVPANTMVQFRCGYGGPLTVSVAEGSAALTVAGGFTFNPDDAPNLTGDTGAKITVTGAGAEGADLVTTIATVDAEGNATLASPAAAAVADVPAWLGAPVPEALRLSIMFQAQFFYEQGSAVDQAVPRVVEALRKSFRNMVS
jgi:hypothetical protein